MAGVAERFRQAVGHVLRQARRERALTLHDVASESGSWFQPSTVGGYERGERAISLERFCELARVYGVPADQLLADVLRQTDPDARREVRIDLSRLSLVPDEPRRVLTQLIDRVRAQREDYISDVITLRQGDVEVVARSLGRSPRRVLQRIRPAIQESDPS